jgi:hypothetical protein
MTSQRDQNMMLGPWRQRPNKRQGLPTALLSVLFLLVVLFFFFSIASRIHQESMRRADAEEEAARRKAHQKRLAEALDEYRSLSLGRCDVGTSAMRPDSAGRGIPPGESKGLLAPGHKPSDIDHWWSFTLGTFEETTAATHEGVVGFDSSGCVIFNREISTELEWVDDGRWKPGGR